MDRARAIEEAEKVRKVGNRWTPDKRLIRELVCVRAERRCAGLCMGQH